jgi:hypothetical protein
VRFELLERAPFTQQRIDLVLGLLAHRAGVHEQDVGFGRIVRGLKSGAGFEHVAHAGRVVLVHLAAESFDVVAAGHRGVEGKSGR